MKTFNTEKNILYFVRTSFYITSTWFSTTYTYVARHYHKCTYLWISPEILFTISSNSEDRANRRASVWSYSFKTKSRPSRSSIVFFRLHRVWWSTPRVSWSSFFVPESSSLVSRNNWETVANSDSRCESFSCVLLNDSSRDFNLLCMSLCKKLKIERFSGHYIFFICDVQEMQIHFYGFFHLLIIFNSEINSVLLSGC